MAKQTVSTETEVDGKTVGPVVVEYDFGDNVADAVGKFGDEVVASYLFAQLKIALQAYVRGLLKQGKSEAEIKTAVAQWKPGTRKPGKSKLEKAQDILKGMTDEERKALIAQLKGGK